MNLKIGLLYLSLHNQLVKKYGINHIISIKEFNIKLGKHFITPQNLRPVILKEMEKKELIERVTRDSIKILPCGIDIEKDVSKLYQLVGLY